MISIVIIIIRSAAPEPPSATAGFEPVQRSRSGSLNERKPGSQVSSGPGGINSGTANRMGPGATLDTHLQLQDELVEAADDFLNQYSQG